MFEFERLTKTQRQEREHKVATYEQQLRGNPDIAAAHLKARGITGSVCQEVRLGFVCEPLPGDEHHRGRLVIPYLARSGVTWIKTRALPGSERESVKYLWITEGSGARIYNAQDMLRRSSVLAITEGEVDTIILSHLCDVPAVGLPGSSTWRPEYRRLFEDYDTVFVAGDGDDAGRQFSKKVAGDLKSKAKVVNMPDGMDVNEFYLEHGREGVRQLLGLDS